MFIPVRGTLVLNAQHESIDSHAECDEVVKELAIGYVEYLQLDGVLWWYVLTG